MSDEISHPWPSKSDVAFGLGFQPDFSSSTIAIIDRIVGLSDSTIHADAFRECADLVVNSLQGGEYPFSSDKFFLPIAFLYRHAIELSLKEATEYAMRIELLQDDESIREAMSGHNLYRLWNVLKPAILTFWPGADTSSLKGAERIISQFHELDKSGQAFRYPRLKDGRLSFAGVQQLPEAVDLLQLKKAVKGLCNFLNGCTSGFMDAYSNMPRGEYL